MMKYSVPAFQNRHFELRCRVTLAVVFDLYLEVLLSPSGECSALCSPRFWIACIWTSTPRPQIPSSRPSPAALVPSFQQLQRLSPAQLPALDWKPGTPLTHVRVVHIAIYSMRARSLGSTDLSEGTKVAHPWTAMVVFIVYLLAVRKLASARFPNLQYTSRKVKLLRLPLSTLRRSAFVILYWCSGVLASNKLVRALDCRVWLFVIDRSAVGLVFGE